MGKENCGNGGVVSNVCKLLIINLAPRLEVAALKLLSLGMLAAAQAVATHEALHSHFDAVSGY